MPKVKKSNKENNENDENNYPSKTVLSKKKLNPVFKFDIKRILKERQAEGEFLEKNAELDKQMKVVDDMFQEQVNQIKLCEDKKHSVPPKFGYVVFNSSMYNKNFEGSSVSDLTMSCSQQLLLMSTEKNELEANIHFNCLMKANWSPVLDDVKNVLCNWGADLDTLINKPLFKSQINDYTNIGRHNFELVVNYLSHSILNNNNGFGDSDLLTLAKFIVTISFDHHCGQMINVIKQLFGTCIEKALHDDDDTAIIAFAQELYSQHNEDDLPNMVVDLFLPLEGGHVMRKMYSYLTYKLYKSLLGKTNNINLFPSNINDWFVQDLVSKDYFKQNDKKVLSCVIRLLEHVVIVFDLYKEEEKLSNMYDFLYSIIKPSGSSESLKLINILDQWRLKLFRLHINRKTLLV